MASLGRHESLLKGICTYIIVTGTYMGFLDLPMSGSERSDQRVISTRVASISLLVMCLEYYGRSRLSVGMLQALAHGDW